jgi:rhodanese-related sulfurtransferase
VLTSTVRNSAKEENTMPMTLKNLMDAANAAVPRISRIEAETMVSTGNALIVDVRDAPELEASGKIPGSLHIPRGMLEFRADPASPYFNPTLDKSKIVIVHCASGGRSALAGKLLKDMGYEKVYNLGGFKDWVESGGSVESPMDKGM